MLRTNYISIYIYIPGRLERYPNIHITILLFLVNITCSSFQLSACIVDNLFMLPVVYAFVFANLHYQDAEKQKQTKMLKNAEFNPSSGFFYMVLLVNMLLGDG